MNKEFRYIGVNILHDDKVRYVNKYMNNVLSINRVERNGACVRECVCLYVCVCTFISGYI